MKDHGPRGRKPRLRVPNVANVGMLIAATALLAACGGGGSSSGAGASSGHKVTSTKVIFADYGGTTRDARLSAFLDPFGRAFGVRPITADADPAKLQIFSERKRSEWDLIDMDGWDVVRFSQNGQIQRLPTWVKKVDLVPAKYRPYASGGYVATNGIGYRKDKVPAPTSWADFFNLKKFPGKRALPTYAYFEIEIALLADGVGCKNLYPLDFARGFEKLESIRRNTLFYDSYGQAVQYLAQGSVTMALLPNSRIQVMKDQGFPVDFMWNHGIVEWTAAAVPAYAPDRDAAFALVNYMAQPQQQATFARLTKYGPTNSAAFKLLDPTTRSDLPNAHFKGACKADMHGLAKQYDDYSKRYTAWLGKG